MRLRFHGFFRIQYPAVDHMSSIVWISRITSLIISHIELNLFKFFMLKQFFLKKPEFLDHPEYSWFRIRQGKNHLRFEGHFRVCSVSEFSLNLYSRKTFRFNIWICLKHSWFSNTHTGICTKVPPLTLHSVIMSILDFSYIFSNDRNCTANTKHFVSQVFKIYPWKVSSPVQFSGTKVKVVSKSLSRFFSTSKLLSRIVDSRRDSPMA